MKKFYRSCLSGSALRLTFQLLIFPIIFFNSAFLLKAQVADTTLALQYLEESNVLGKDRKVKESIDLLEKAAIIFEKYEQWENWVRTQRGLMNNYGMMRDLGKSLEVTENALDIGLKKIGMNSIGVNRLILDRANVLYFLGEYKKAITIVENELPNLLRVYGKEHDIVGFAYSVLGNAYNRSGNLDKALDAQLLALDTYKIVYGEYDANMASQYEQTGNTYIYLKDYTQALEYHQKALEIRLVVFKDENHPRLSHSYTNLAICYTEVGEVKKAESYFLKSFEIQKKTYGESNPRIASFLWNLGQFYNTISKKEKALECYEQELAIRKKMQTNLPHWADNYTRLGNLYGQLSRFDEAFSAFNESFKMISDTFSASSIYDNPAVEQIELNIYGLRTGLGKLRTLYASVKKNPTDKKAMTSGLELGELCMDFWRELRYELGRQQQSKNESTEMVRRAAQYAGLFAYRLYELTGDEKYVIQAFQFAERGKSLLLQEAQLQTDARNFSDLPDEILAQENRLSEELAKCESQFLTAWKQKDSIEASRLRNEELFVAKRGYEKLIRQIEQDYPNYYNLKYRNSIIDITEIQNKMSEEQVFIEYLLQKETNELLIFSLEKNNSPRIYQVEFSAEIEKKVMQFHKLLKGFQLSRRDRQQKFVQLSHELYRILVEPIEDDIKEKKKIIIVGEDFTNYIPFETLLPSGQIKPFSELDFLLKNYEITYQYSVNLWEQSLEKKNDFEKGLLAFAPVFLDEAASDSKILENSGALRDTVLRSFDKEGNFVPLKYSEKEVKRIAELFKEQKKEEVDVLLKRNATEKNLKSKIVQNYKIVHLASHSFSNLQYPELSGIGCFSSSDMDAENGILFCGEIYNLQINSDLVVLSSCESGIGKLLNGEGMLGLNRSFVYAGVPNVVFSLWKVLDRLGSNFMIDFYTRILSGKPYAEALRASKLKMLENEETASPEFWGAYLLIGR